MSYGRHGGRSTRAPSVVSSASSSSTASSTTCGTSPDFAAIQKVIRSVFRSSKISVQQVEKLQGRLHQVYLSRLADGSSLVLKCPPHHNTRLLRHEKNGLETQRKTLEFLHEYTSLPVPQLIKYDSHGGSFGSAFLLMTVVPGRRVSDLSPYLSTSQKADIERTLGSYVRNLTTLSATQFGPTHKVFAKEGSSSWRKAFLALLEASLRDAEDMLVNVPYDSIRYYVDHHKRYLEEVTEPRLVAVDVCEPQNVMLDASTYQVTGLVGFSNVVWGDPLMSGGIADGSSAFFEGFGQCPTKTGGVKARMLMYTIYKAVLRIVANHYRPGSATDEDDARADLNYALNDLARM